MWHLISNAPFDRDLEIAVVDRDGPHALVFPCRRMLTGWVKSVTRERVEVSPTHWRDWEEREQVRTGKKLHDPARSANRHL